MANVRVRLDRKAGDFSAQADILDTPGINNKWKSLTPKAWGVEGGKFTNLLGKANAFGDGILALWELYSFDIDSVKVNDAGDGDNNDGDGSFAPSPIKWTVLKVF